MGSNGPGYLWKAERIRNLSIVKNLKKSFFFIYLKSLKNRVAAIGPRGCNRFYSGNGISTITVPAIVSLFIFIRIQLTSRSRIVIHGRIPSGPA